jgi:hypothetical protein
MPFLASWLLRHSFSRMEVRDLYLLAEGNGTAAMFQFVETFSTAAG